MASSMRLDDYPAPRLRVVLIAGFAGIAIISFLAIVDAVRLLDAMQTENKILRDQAVARTNHLASIHSSVLLIHTYMGEYFVDTNQQNAKEYLTKVQAAWEHTRSDLASYQSSTPGEEELLKRLTEMLTQDLQDINRSMSSAAGERRSVIPSETAVVEITERLQDIGSKQEAAAEAEIQNQFGRLGARLRNVLSLALAAALVLALGCLAYIFRIERQNRHRYGEIVAGRKALEQLSARLVDAQETERRAISRELHDQVGQTLNALLVDAANLAKRLPPEDDVSRRYLDNIRTFADSSVNSIRDIALLLRPSMLDDLGLIPALEWQAREVSRRTGIKVEVAAENVPDSLPDDVRTCIYRVVQEALQNVSRHSGAKSAVIVVRNDVGSLSLTVADDGRGFDLQRRGLGMMGMEERVRQLGGRLEVESAPGKGATLRVSLPIAAAIRS